MNSNSLIRLSILFLVCLLFVGILACTPAPNKPIPPDDKPTAGYNKDNNSTDNYTGKLGVGDVAPDFTLKNIAGEEVTLSNFRGKKVIINLWWMRCHGCLDEMLYFQEFYEKYSDKGLTFLTINSYDREAVIKAYFDSKGFTFTILVDLHGKLSKAYTNCGVPTTFFIDGEGVVKAKKDAGFESVEEIENLFNSY